MDYSQLMSTIAGHINNTNTNIANLGSTLMTNLFNKRNVDANNALQMFLASQANKWQIDQRNYENWYNSPAGLQSRGLNPALAMSSAGGSLAPSVSAGEAHVAPTEAFHNIAPQFADPSQDILAMSQARLNEADADKIEAETELRKSELPIKQQELINKKQELNNLIRENEVLAAKVRSLDAGAQKDIAEAVNIPKMYDLHSKEIDAKIDLMRSDKLYHDALTRLTNRDIWERCASWTLRLKGLDLQNDEVAARAGLERSQTTTEWFKAQNYAADSMLKGTQMFKTYTEGYLLATGIPEAELSARAFSTDSAIADSPLGGFMFYTNHVIGRAVAPILNRFSLGVKFGSNSSTIKSSTYRSPNKLN